MSILAIAEFFVKPEKAADFLAAMEAALPETRAYEGCELIETYVEQDDPGHIFLIERWRARADHESYLGWRTETGAMDFLGPLLAAPPKFTYYDPRPGV